jgi:hypothetical protein
MRLALHSPSPLTSGRWECQNDDDHQIKYNVDEHFIQNYCMLRIFWKQQNSFKLFAEGLGETEKIDSRFSKA